MNWYDWDDYERFWMALIGMVLLIGLAHIVVYYFLNRATVNALKVRRAFLLRCQRHLAAFWWVFLVSAFVGIFGITGALICCAVISFLGFFLEKSFDKPFFSGSSLSSSSLSARTDV